MPIERFLKGVVSAKELELAREIYDEACREFRIAADDGNVKLALAEVIMAAMHSNKTPAQIKAAVWEMALGLGRRPSVGQSDTN